MVLKDTLEHSKAVSHFPEENKLLYFYNSNWIKELSFVSSAWNPSLGGYYSKGIVMGNTARVPLEIPYISPNI